MGSIHGKPQTTSNNVDKISRLLRGFVSNEALDIIIGELQRLSALKLDSSNCGCKLRNSCGLPCACMLSDYSNAGGCIPLDSIDIFWRKLDLSPTSFVEDDDICCDDELEMFKESFNKQPTVRKKSFLRKLKEIFDPSTTIIEEPAVQINTRGRPSVKQQQRKNANHQNQAPRRHSCATTSEFIGMNLNKEPERRCSIDLNSEPVFDLYDESLAGYGSLWKEVPKIFHPYITDIKDVLGDGNCGFRSIAVGLGIGEDRWLYVRQQLLNELSRSYHAYARVYNYAIDELKILLTFSQSPAPLKQHWMIMPLTSILIANTFGVIVHSLSNAQSVTCFPLWKGPAEFQHHQILSIAYVHGNHFVMVQLGDKGLHWIG